METGNPLKISLLVRYFTIGGLERVVIALANEYVRRGYETQIIIVSRGKRNSLITELDERVGIVFLDGNIFRKAKVLRASIRGTLVHIHFGDGKIHPWIRMQLLHAKKTITYHSVYRHKRNTALNLVDHFFNRNLKTVIAVSDAVKEFCVEDVKLDPGCVTVIRNGMKVEDRAVSLAGDGNALRVLVLCSLYPHKNHREILELFGKLKKDGITDFHITFIGDGPCMSELYLQARDTELSEHITWMGAVWNRELVDMIFEKSDLFLSASTYEGFPISILESMRYHIPLLLSDIPPHREAGGDAALYYRLGDYDSFKAAITRFMSDRSLLKKHGDMCFERLKMFDIGKTVDRYLEAYLRIWNE